MNVYDVGDMVRLRVSFANSAGTAVDPSTVTLQIRRESDAQGSYSNLIYGVNSITKAGTGEYYHDFSVTSDGMHRYRWNGLGANPAASETPFMIRQRWVGV